MSEPAAKEPDLALIGARPWAPRAEIAPDTERSPDGTFVIRSNGSEGCYGGWELELPPGREGEHFLFRMRVRWRDLAAGFESIEASAQWLGTEGNRLDWSPVRRWQPDGDWLLLEERIANTSGADRLVVKLLMRWSATGQIEWRDPEIVPCDPPAPRTLRLGAASSPEKPVGPVTLASNRDRYVRLCREAGDAGVHLLCLPETILSWQLPQGATADLPERAVEVPGPMIDPFCEVAREYGMAIGFSVNERVDDKVYNTGLLVDEAGNIAATYRKVHLAINEAWSGVTPGQEFPVGRIRSADARVGMTICMDSSSAESARIVARRGAEIMLLPIMGDWRAADRVGPGRGSSFRLDRWTLIHQMRALDNHMYLVVARNSGLSSGIFSPLGTTLAMNTGETPLIWADVDLGDLKRHWTGPPWRDVVWYQRRESAYAPLSGALQPASP